MNTNTFLGIGTSTLFVLICVLGIITWGYGLHYLIMMERNFDQKRKWGSFLPWVFFLPNFFTDMGNFYRLKFLYTLRLFLLLLFLGCAVVWFNLTFTS